MGQCFHIQFVRPNGWSYEMWPYSASEVEAVAAANTLLEYVERVGISDYLQPDGISVSGGAELRISRVDEPPTDTARLRISRPDGTVVGK